MSGPIPEECIRKPEEIEIRKQRADLYKKLREQNDKTRKAEDKIDDFDIFEGGNTSNKPSTGGGNISNALKKVKNVSSRLATLNASNVDSLIQSLQECNLSHFMEEAVSNLMKANIKMADVPSFVSVCSLLYQQYPKDFPKQLQTKIFETIKSEETTAPRRRTILCAYSDLLIVHVYTSNSHLLPILEQLIKADINTRKFENDSYIWRIISYCGADLVGVNRGADTIMDPIFPPKECILAPIRPHISTYYSAIVDSMKNKAKEGMEAREESYQLFLQMGKFNTRPDKKAKECKAEYDRLVLMAKKYGFIMKKEPEEFWKNEEEMVEITTPEGPVLIPKRVAEKIRPNDPLNSLDNNANKSQPLVDINTIITEKLSLDIDGIRKELDVAQDIQRVDLLSIYYLTIDSPENQEKIINHFTHISRVNINVTHFYARFIANISQKFPEIGTNIAKQLETAFINFVNAQNKSQGTVAFSPKLHIARYISELAMLNVGIESYFNCLSFSLNHFYGKTIDMACTLILTAGKFLDDFCDATHIQIRKAIDKLKLLRDKEVFQQHIGVIINQAIELFEKPEENQGGESRPVPSLNKYQAFAQYILQSTDRQKSERDKKDLIERMWHQSDVTHVTPFFIISQILELENYSLSQLSQLSRLVSEFAKTNIDFVASLVDILLERIRRGIERDSFAFRQRQLLEVRFLSELVNSRVISYDIALKTAFQILSLNMPKPNNYIIVVEGKNSHKIKINPSDFFKVKMVCELIDALLPSLKKFCSKKPSNDRNRNKRFSYTPDRDDQKCDANFIKMYSEVLFHLQLFYLIRGPIPTQTAFDVSDLFDKLEESQIEGTERYESLKDEKLRSKTNGIRFTNYSIYAINPPKLNLIIKPNHQMQGSDEESSGDASDPDEELFKKELNEVKEEFRVEANAKNPGGKKPPYIPPDLMLNNTTVKQLDESEKMTLTGPPVDFNIALPPQGPKDKLAILSFSPSTKDDQPKPQ